MLCYVTHSRVSRCLGGREGSAVESSRLSMVSRCRHHHRVSKSEKRRDTETEETDETIDSGGSQKDVGVTEVDSAV